MSQAFVLSTEDSMVRETIVSVLLEQRDQRRRETLSNNNTNI